LRVHQKHGHRAPHKPLLLLYALGELRRGALEIPFERIEQRVGSLLREFGTSHEARQPAPALPFWHLRNDGLWTVQADAELPMGANGKRPNLGDLRRLHARGRMPEDVAAALRRDPKLVAEVAHRLLDEHFAPSQHQDILDAVGLTPVDDLVVSVRRRRDPEFRGRVLTAYQRRCAVCGFGLRLGDDSVAVEAAHIRWHNHHGPDVEPNGLALCALHHKVFDRGAFTIDHHHRLLVSEHALGDGLDWALLHHHGKPIAAPIRPEHRPAAEFVDWHHGQVFRQRARPLSA
ncbi:MAG: hypothetical protein RL398_633, partial [Planctomycetota bacterium]